jgi:hypothetical protein
MAKNKFQHLVDCLTNKEKKRFPGWLKNELQGRNQEMWIWFEQIWERKTDEQAWAALYAGEDLDQSKINNWTTLLIGWVEEYISICSFRKDTFARIHYLNRTVIRKNPLHIYPSTIRKSRKLLDKQPIRDKTYFQIQHELDRLDLEFSKSYPGVQIRRYKLDPRRIRQNEEMAFLLTNIEIALRRLTANEPLTKWDQHCITQLKAYVEEDSSQVWPVAYLYTRIFAYLQKPAIIPGTEAQALVAFYQKHFKTLRSDAQFTVGILIHNCLGRSYFRQEDRQVIELIFEINSWILHRSQIYGARYFYRNMVQIPIMIARKSNDTAEKQELLQLAHHYLEDLKDKLPADEREEAYQYNLAELHFEEGNFAGLARQFYALQFKDYAYEINYLILWNKAQYELGELEGLAERLKNLQISLQQTLKLKANFRKRQLNQVKYFRKMVLNYRPSILRRLKKELLEEQIITERGWLLEKLDQKILVQEGR